MSGRDKLDKDVPQTGSIKLGWEAEELDEDAKVVGSVVEFAFGPEENSYLACSYPYRPHWAQDDERTIATYNIPKDVCQKIRTLRPRYIMHIAFRREPYTWVIYCYRGSRYAYDTKWQPKKYNALVGSLGKMLDEWKEDESDQISYCSFGNHPDKWFMRSTNDTTEWLSQVGPGVPYKLRKCLYKFQLRGKEIERKDKSLNPATVSTIRAATLGADNAWILYTKNDFEWSENDLPAPLVKALELGKYAKPKPWVINKAVLNPYNAKEFVLVYDNGIVFCAFDPNFLADFKKVIGEWAQSKGFMERVQFLNPEDIADLDGAETTPAYDREEYYDAREGGVTSAELEARHSREEDNAHSEASDTVMVPRADEHDLGMSPPRGSRQERPGSRGATDGRSSRIASYTPQQYRSRPSADLEDLLDAEFLQTDRNAQQRSQTSPAIPPHLRGNSDPPHSLPESDDLAPSSKGFAKRRSTAPQDGAGHLGMKMQLPTRTPSSMAPEKQPGNALDFGSSRPPYKDVQEALDQVHRRATKEPQQPKAQQQTNASLLSRLRKLPKKPDWPV